jgi:hypothetical protein
MPPETDESKPGGVDAPYRLEFPFSCFQAWQRWFRFGRTEGNSFRKVVEADATYFLRKRGGPALDELLPPEWIPRTQKRISLAQFYGRPVRIADTPSNDRAPLALMIDATGIVDILAAIMHAEHLVQLTRLQCANCPKTFIPEGKKTRFCNPDCGLQFHKRAWARGSRDEKAPQRARRRSARV